MCFPHLTAAKQNYPVLIVTHYGDDDHVFGAIALPEVR